ncbi:MAG: hypothetical protein NTV61_02890 [Candidatus Bathyarchaeota archaeon]|nr:hypothetical protein [Candidatus Bathyarchaeota archaeon]
MSGNIDLKELQRKAMSSFHEDGIIDIMIGLLGLIWGFSAFTDDSSMSVIWIAVVIPPYWWLKREYTIPRIGLVRFSPRGEGGLLRILVTGLVGAAIAVGLALWWGATSASKPFYYYIIANYWGLIFGASVAVVGAVYARVANIPRLYAYSALALVLIGSAQYSGLPFGVHLLALGAVFLGYGGYLRHRFIGKYPVQAVDGQDG